MKTTLTIAALAAMLSLSAAPAAYAADEALLARLKSLMAEQGTTVTWDKVEEYADADGGEVTALINAKLATGSDETVIAKIELVDVEEQDSGWRIGSLRMPQHTVVEDGTTVTLTDFSLDGAVVPPEGQSATLMMYESASLSEMTVSNGGKQVFSLHDLAIEVTGQDGGRMEFSGAADSFRADLGAVEDEASRATIQALGYESIEGGFEFAGSWNPDDGMLELSQYDISVNDAGTLGISLHIGGYTRDFLESLRQMSAQMSANPGNDSATGMAALGLMQQLTFHSARIEFTDDTLTKRALEFVASQQGAKPADIANQAKAVVPFAMMQLNNPQLTAQVTQAVSAFLDNPKNLAIVARPANPMPFALIMAGAMSAPEALPQQLGVEVIAND